MQNREERSNRNPDDYSRDDRYTRNQTYGRRYDSDQGRNEFDDEYSNRPLDSRFSPYQSGYGDHSDYSYDSQRRQPSQNCNRFDDRSSRDRSEPYRESDDRQSQGQSRASSQRGKGPKGYSRSDDRIKEDVCDELCDNDRIDASDISVEVKDGEVQLSGKVESREIKREAEDCCNDVRGVKDVMNQLRVTSSNVRNLKERSESKDSETNAKRKASK